jgi:hypothetical protein
MEPSPLLLLLFSGLLYQHLVIDGDDCGAVNGMNVLQGNRSTRRKPAPVTVCPPQIPLDLTRPRNRATAVGSWRLTTWPRPYQYLMIFWYSEFSSGTRPSKLLLLKIIALWVSRFTFCIFVKTFLKLCPFQW